MRISRKKKHNFKPTKTYFRYNERINSESVRVIDENGEHIGTMSTASALIIAKEHGFDLVEINPASDPPIAKIMEYGQFKYQQEKQEKLRKAKQKETEIKGIRLSARIGQHDMDIRIDQAVKFMEKGNNVRVEIILRGREKGHVDIAYNIINQFIKTLDEQRGIRVEQPIKRIGAKLATVLAPTSQDTTTKTDDETDDEEVEEILEESII